MFPPGILCRMAGCTHAWPFCAAWKVAFPWSEMQDRAGLHSATGAGWSWQKQTVNREFRLNCWVNFLSKRTRQSTQERETGLAQFAFSPRPVFYFLFLAGEIKIGQKKMDDHFFTTE